MFPHVAAVLLSLVLCLPAAFAQAVFAYSVQSDADDHLHRINVVTGEVIDLGWVGINDAEGLTAVGDRVYAIGGTIEEVWDITEPPGFRVGFTIDRSCIDAGLAYDITTEKLYNIQGCLGGGSCLYEINFSTGGTLVGTSPYYADGLAIDGAGNAFTADFSAQVLYSVNLATGQLTPVGPMGLPYVAGDCGLDFDLATGTLYALNDGIGTPAVAIYTLDTETGHATLVTLLPGWGYEGLAVLRVAILGDLNCDGLVDFGDINPFVLALSNPAAYAQQYPSCSILNGDINGDGSVDFGDINPFVQLLTGM